MRNQQVRGKAAATMDADAARLHAEVLVAAATYDTLPASHPRVDQSDVANRYALRIRPDGDNLADVFVAHGQRQLDAAIQQLQLLAATDVVIAVPDVEVGVADARRDDAQHDLRARRLRRFALHALQRRTALADIVAEHESLP